MDITYQRIRKVVGGDRVVKAEMYYGVISALNGLKLTERETQLVAYTAVRGNMSYANIRQDFCNRYSTTLPTVNNMISRMKKLGVFIKENGKVKVCPVLSLDFGKDVVLQVSLENEKDKKV